MTHTFDERDVYTVSVTVRGNKGSIGVADHDLSVRRKAPEQNPTPSSGRLGPASAAAPVAGSGGGGGRPRSSPAARPLAVHPELPPPSTSPPSDPGRGPNLDPSAPGDTSTETGEEVTGILVSTSAPAQAGANRPGQTPRNQQEAQQKDEGGTDWKLVGGISLTALLVILGAVRERVHLQRLLPQPQ